MTKTFILFILTAFALLSCGKPELPTTLLPPIDLPPVIPPRVKPGVYIAGDSIGPSNSSLPYAVYWKDGKQFSLPNASYSSASGIAVTDSNLYVSNSGIFSIDTVTYWKNGVGVKLADATLLKTYARAIVLSGSDLYTVGIANVNGLLTSDLAAVFWKFKDYGIQNTTYSTYQGAANDIAVNGNDIYLAGEARDPLAGWGSGSFACIWKNGTPNYLRVSSAPFGADGKAKSIVVSGVDVHVAGDLYELGGGFRRGSGVYWKNGVALVLTSPPLYSEANAITVVNNDVYIAGVIYGLDGQPRAVYWKNGVPVYLENSFSGANDIVVDGNDVYVVGRYNNEMAVYWKNGARIVLGKGSANAIVIRK